MASSPQGARPNLNVDRSTVSASAFVRDDLSPQEDAGGYMSDDAATRALRTGTRKINKTLRQLNPFKVPTLSRASTKSGWDVEWAMLQGRLAGPAMRTKTFYTSMRRSNGCPRRMGGGSIQRSSLLRRCASLRGELRDVVQAV